MNNGVSDMQTCSMAWFFQEGNVACVGVFAQHATRLEFALVPRTQICATLACMTLCVFSVQYFFFEWQAAVFRDVSLHMDCFLLCGCVRRRKNTYVYICLYVFTCLQSVVDVFFLWANSVRGSGSGMFSLMSACSRPS